MSRPLVSLTAAALISGLAGCFAGDFALGRQCVDDADCGPSLACINNLCGGETGSTSTTLPMTESTGSTTDMTGSESDTGSETDSGSETTTETGGEPACKNVDMLLVLDNSQSMDQWDGRLINLAFNFEEEVTGLFLGNAESFHFGVITTDAYEDNTDGCNQLGAIARYGGAQEGPCEFVEGFPFATEQDSLTEALGCMAIVGDGDDNERPMQAMLTALSPEFNAPGGCNEGFVREDALLVVVVITDEDDDHADVDAQGNSGSLGDPADWYEQLIAIKGGDPEAVVVGVLTGEDQEAGSCPWDLGPFDDESEAMGAEEAKRIEQFVNMLPFNHRAVDSICRDEYISFFSALFTVNAQIACEEFVPPGEGETDTGTG